MLGGGGLAPEGEGEFGGTVREKLETEGGLGGIWRPASGEGQRLGARAREGDFGKRGVGGEEVGLSGSLDF